MGFLDKLKNGLKKTRESVSYAFSSEKLDDDFYEELEELLILADAGADTASEIAERLRETVKREHILDPEEGKAALKRVCADLMRPERPLDLSGDPAVIMLIGVNGAGKTTTAGKLALSFRQAGRNVLIAAADTFRRSEEHTSGLQSRI